MSAITAKASQKMKKYALLTREPRCFLGSFAFSWEQRKVQDVADRFDNLRIPVAANLRVHGTTPYYGANGIQDYVEGFTHDGEFVLVAEDGANDLKNYPVKCVNGRIWVNNHAHVLQGKAGIADNSFLAFAISQSDIESLLVGGGRAKLNAETLMSIEFRLPCLQEQYRIGEYLTQLDHLITLHQRKCEYLCSLFQAVFSLIFTTSTFSWEQRKLGELISEYKETVDSSCTLPVLTSSKTEGVILQEEHFGRKQQHDITGYNVLPRSYCTYRNRSDGVDFTFNVNECCDMGIISKFYPVFCGNDNDTYFLSLVLNNSDEVVHEIAYTCTGTGQKVLSFLDLQEMSIRVPRHNEQKKISAYFKQLDHLITLHQRKPFLMKWRTSDANRNQTNRLVL